MANEFNILTQVKADTTPAQKTYDIWKSSVEKQSVKVTVDVDKTTLDSINKQTKEIFSNVNRSLQTVTTETDKYRLSNGGLRTVITETNNAGKQFRTIIDEVTNEEGKLITTTQKLSKEQQGNLTYWKQQGNVIKTSVADYAKATDETNDLKDKISELSQQELIAKANTELFDGANVSLSTSLKKLGNDFVTTTLKVAKFALSTAIIGAFTKATYDAIEVVKDFDSTLTEFKKVSDLSGEALDEYTVKVGELGEAVARTRKFHCGYVQ